MSCEFSGMYSVHVTSLVQLHPEAWIFIYAFLECIAMTQPIQELGKWVGFFFEVQGMLCGVGVQYINIPVSHDIDIYTLFYFYLYFLFTYIYIYIYIIFIKFYFNQSFFASQISQAKKRESHRIPVTPLPTTTWQCWIHRLAVRFRVGCFGGDGSPGFCGVFMKLEILHVVRMFRVFFWRQKGPEMSKLCVLSDPDFSEGNPFKMTFRFRNQLGDNTQLQLQRIHLKNCT